MINVQSRKLCTYFARRANEKLFLKNADAILALNGISREEDRKVLAHVLLTFYDGPNRYYHTTAHINELCKAAGRFFPGEEDPLGTSLTSSEMLAILFHDIVYRSGQESNEQRSMDLMIALMEAYGVPLTEFSWASRIIIETSRHLEEAKDESTHAVLDLDLTSLAESWEVFLANNELIGKEYPNATPKQRIDFLQKFLDKPRIYYRLTHLEVVARENIARYIQHLLTYNGDVNATPETNPTAS